MVFFVLPLLSAGGKCVRSGRYYSARQSQTTYLFSKSVQSTLNNITMYCSTTK
ncbi:hypothetical protein XENTR_v10021795 [Xenopus tropicalis]|nr:hypothetical protein XENTR_v10021795 [Xenopus tropicalis]